MAFSRSYTRLIAAIVASAFFMELLDGTIINSCLPQMAHSFQVRPLDLSVGITIYLLTAAALVPLSGWLADRYGSRNVFMWAIGVFSVASLVCALAHTLTQFALARAVQGMGGALMTPVGRIVVLRNTEKSDLLSATAIITWPALMAPIIAPVVGGFIATYATWRWNFLLNIPLGLIGMILVARFVPNLYGETRTRLDWTGFFLSAATLLSLLYGLESFADAGRDWLLPSVWVALGIMLGTLSVRHFLRAAHPLLDLSAVRLQTFAITTVDAGAICRTAINATPFLLPLMFQLAFGLNAFASGTLVLVYFAGNLGIKPATTPILRWFGFRSVLTVNGMLAGLSIACCGLLAVDTPRWLIVVLLLLTGATRSMQFTCLNTLTFADVTVAQRSSAATLSSMLQQVMSVLGVASGAILLSLSQFGRHAAAVGRSDFRLAFAVVGLAAVGASLLFLKLPRQAGAVVSGHRQPRAAVSP